MIWPPYKKSEQPAALQIASMGISTMIELAAIRSQRDELLAAVKEAREALQFANESPGGGISDTIWMMHRSETLFDFLDAAIEKAQTPIVQHLPSDDTEGGGL